MSMNDPVETLEISEHCTVEIYQDTGAQNPRDEYDHVGTIVHWHREYDLGEDVRPIMERCRGLRHFERYLGICRDAAVVIPVSMIDHSGVSIWAAARRNETSIADTAGWDSGQVGYIYCTREQVRHEWDGDLDKAEKYLRGEVEEFDQYMRGDVYGYVVMYDGEPLDSCWGFYGSEYALEEAKSAGEAACEQEVQTRHEAAQQGIPTVTA